MPGKIRHRPSFPDPSRSNAMHSAVSVVAVSHPKSFRWVKALAAADIVQLYSGAAPFSGAPRLPDMKVGLISIPAKYQGSSLKKRRNGFSTQLQPWTR